MRLQNFSSFGGDNVDLILSAVLSQRYRVLLHVEVRHPDGPEPDVSRNQLARGTGGKVRFISEILNNLSDFKTT